MKPGSGKVKWLVQSHMAGSQAAAGTQASSYPALQNTFIIGIIWGALGNSTWRQGLFWNKCLPLGIISAACVCVALLQ